MSRFWFTKRSVVFCISLLVCAGCGAPSLLMGWSYAGGGVDRLELAKGVGTAPAGIPLASTPGEAGGAGVDMP